MEAVEVVAGLVDADAAAGAGWACDRELAAAVRDAAPAAPTLLAYGAGAGELLLRAVPELLGDGDGRLVVVDAADRIERCRALLAPAGAERSGHVALRAVALGREPLPVERATCDVVVARFALGEHPDLEAALRELARIARPGALLATAELDWASLAWEHPNRPLTELIRQAALRRLTPDPFALRRLPALLAQTGWELQGLQARPHVEVAGGPLLRLAARAADWAVAGVRCTPPEAMGWTADLRRAADAHASFATLTGYLVTGTRT